MARPSKYTEELAREICSRIAAGESLRRICEDDHMPAPTTVHSWVLDGGEFSNQYTKARQIQAETFVDELMDIADDGSNDWMERTGKDGENLGWVVNGEAVQRSRLRLDTRKWYASKIIPKIYGEKQTIDNQSSDGSMSPKPSVVIGKDVPLADVLASIKALKGE
jgi:hypothetical protein